MQCRHFVLFPLVALVLGVQAREPQANAAVTRVAETSVEDLLVQQRRREVLRQATRVQMEEAAAPTRQLSAQERAELRQQLQQQRNELLK